MPARAWSPSPRELAGRPEQAPELGREPVERKGLFEEAGDETANALGIRLVHVGGHGDQYPGRDRGRGGAEELEQLEAVPGADAQVENHGGELGRGEGGARIAYRSGRTHLVALAGQVEGECFEQGQV